MKSMIAMMLKLSTIMIGGHFQRTIHLIGQLHLKRSLHNKKKLKNKKATANDSLSNEIINQLSKRYPLILKVYSILF